MSFPRYPSYKASGIEWLGDVPAHWAVRPLKHVATLASGGTPDKTRIDYWNGNVAWASSKDLKVSTLADTEDHITQLAVDEGAANLIPAGRILVVVRGMILAHSFPVATTVTPMAINQDLKAVRPGDGIELSYLAWLMRGAAGETATRVEEAAHGTKVLRLDRWTSMALPVPPVEEQRALSVFLDRETAKIDALVAEQERLLELLKEKRQAVISHAVTKGLNPDAPMKPSGVEWIGEVPAHWAVAPLKRMASVRTGVAKGKDNGGKATVSVPYLRVANVQDGYLDLDDVSVIEVPAEDIERYSLRPGDVLMNEGGDYDKLGRGHVWHGQIAPCITQNHVFAVRPTGVRSDWLNTFTSSAAAQFYFMIQSKQSTNLASISSTNLMELPVALPPDHEQGVILHYLSDHLCRLDALAAQTHQAIGVLREHRTALVSAAVTGQIDVRGLAVSGDARHNASWQAT